MRIPISLAMGLASILGWAQAPGPSTPSWMAPPAKEEDPLLQALIHDALDRYPEISRSKALVEAERERILQAKALPDPTISLGLQNDGFKRLEVGRMETSYYQVMVTQPLPWPGKRGLRGEVARLGVDAAQWSLLRARLSLRADVKRAYFGLLLARGQLQLLDQQATFLQQAEAITRVRYEVGQGAQADLLRAQLERTRLQQQRLGLQSQEAVSMADLNRLRGAALETHIPTTASLEAVPLETVSAPALIARAEQDSPELLAAKIGVHQAEKSLDLARLDRKPDFGVSAGLMPRGSLDPMWTVGVSVSLPIWGRQNRAIAEQEWRRKSQGFELENVRGLLAQRIHERAAQLEAALGIIKIYREGLLVQSEASFKATLAQYEAGRAPFLSVLETLNGWTSDRGGLLQALAQAQALRVAQEAFDLGATAPISAPAPSSVAMGMGGNPAAPARSAPKPSGDAPSAGASAMKSM
ncbi:MAG TPA: TolC family protein [Holophaga sp.]|nr:TolC family protein [Holophaga sp.]